MEDVSVRYRAESPSPLLSLTPEDRAPWDRTRDYGRGSDARIPYSLAIADDDPNREAILEAAREHEGITSAQPRRR